MPTLYGFLRLLKNLVIIVLILAIAIPLRYGSTNPRYLSVRLFHLALSLKHSIISDSARPTLSADYRAFEDLLRMKPLSKRDPTEDSLTIVKRLRSLTVISNLVPKPSQCQITKEVFEHDDHTVDTYWIDNHQREFQRHADHIIVYFHGGGYMLGDINSKLFNIIMLVIICFFP
jgi:acetyl esterase/lipase